VQAQLQSCSVIGVYAGLSRYDCSKKNTFQISFGMALSGMVTNAFSQAIGHRQPRFREIHGIYQTYHFGGPTDRD
jgi:hypothetical protein